MDPITTLILTNTLLGLATAALWGILIYGIIIEFKDRYKVKKLRSKLTVIEKDPSKKYPLRGEATNHDEDKIAKAS